MLYAVLLTAGEPERAMGGVPPCGREGIGDASRAVASERGTEPTTDLGGSSVDGPGGLEPLLDREVMFAVW